MNEQENGRQESGDAQPHGPRRNGHGWSRRVRLGAAAAVLLGLGALGGGLATVSVTAGAHMFRGHHGGNVEEMTEHARERVSWVLGRVDATEEQERQVDAIVTDLIRDLVPVRIRHHEHRREVLAQLLRDQPDPLRLEDIRRQELALADTASARILDAVVRTAAVLTPDQREALLERFHRRHH